MPCYDLVYKEGPPERIQCTFDDLLDEFAKRVGQGAWNTWIVGAYKNGEE